MEARCFSLPSNSTPKPGSSPVMHVANLKQDPLARNSALFSPQQKNCVIEELSNFEFFSELLGEMGAEIAMALP